MMHVLLVVGTWIAIFLVHVEGAERFGCKFEDSDYRVTAKFPLFAPRRMFGVKFRDNVDKLKNFYEVVEQCKAEVFKETVVDEITHFNRMFEAMKAKGLKYGDQSIIEKFAHDYALPMNASETYLDLVFKVLDKIKFRMPHLAEEIENNFFFAGVTTAVPDQSIALLESGTSREDVGGLDPAHFVGVIKVQPGSFMFGKSLSFIIIDMEYAVTPTPMLGTKVQGSYNPSASYYPEHKYTSYGDPVEYKFLDKNNSYLQVTISDVNNPETKSNNIMFMAMPFCSFVEADNYQVLGNLIRMMAKITPEGKLVAGVTALLPGYEPQVEDIWSPDPRERIYYNQKPDIKSVTVPDFSSEDSANLVKDVLSAMDVTGDKQEKALEMLKENRKLGTEIVIQQAEDYEKYSKNKESQEMKQSILGRVAESVKNSMKKKDGSPVEFMQNARRNAN